MDTDEQAKQIGDLLEQKGYYKSFSFNGGIHWSMEKGLPLYLQFQQLGPPGKSEFPLRVSTDIHLGREKGNLFIAFKVGYDEVAGFTLDEMKVMRWGLHRRSLSKKQLQPASWEKVPSLSDVDRMLAMGKRQKRRLS